ncbi:2-iminobutanoate/2-iminopropanoate deaminase [bacterium HR17]|uniref:2-iminobutanoate/2-iminopropanoate deaminase n=1 Tax=Candidatus Fervidibacter japonicus TaxID=2035412 RepID=A0A2H5XAG0_9BACT|nr:2-iminobutanoate/2-iminopropanoate deaminase [bacterium HR17]
MGRQPVQTPNAPTPKAPYSQAIVANGCVFVSGQVAIDPATGEPRHGAFEDELRLALRNLQAILEAAGSSLDKVVKVTVFLADMGNFPKLNEVYREFFSPPYPARTTVQAQPPGGFQVEVECIAVV